MADIATLQTRLEEAEAAYHKLLTGARVVEVQHGDMRTKYTEAESGALATYIAQLREQIAMLDTTGATLRRRGLVVDL